MSDQKDDSLEISLPTLEEPTVIDSAAAGAGTLLNDDLGITAAKLVALESLFKLLTSDIKFQDFMREILLIVMRAVQSEAGSILEIDHEKNSIFFRAAVGHTSDQIVKFVIPMGQGIVGHVAESRETLVVSNVGENSIHLKSIQKAVGFDARNLIAIPLIIRGRIFGVLELLNRVGEDEYTTADIELLNSLCQMVSKTIEVRLMLAWAKRTEKKAA